MGQYLVKYCYVFKQQSLHNLWRERKKQRNHKEQGKIDRSFVLNTPFFLEFTFCLLTGANNNYGKEIQI